MNGSARNSPRLVLFDVDGTLVETGGAGRIAFVEVLEAMFPETGFEDAVAGVRFQGKTDPVIIDEIVRNAGVSDRFSTRAGEFWSRYVATLGEVLSRPGLRRRALPGVVAMLEDLEGRAGVYLGLQTGNVEAGARAKLEAIGLGRFFPEGGFASDHWDRRELVRMARDKLARRSRRSRRSWSETRSTTSPARGPTASAPSRWTAAGSRGPSSKRRDRTRCSTISPTSRPCAPLCSTGSDPPFTFDQLS